MGDRTQRAKGNLNEAAGKAEACQGRSKTDPRRAG